jgi:hypothetical protein
MYIIGLMESVMQRSCGVGIATGPPSSADLLDRDDRQRAQDGGDTGTPEHEGVVLLAGEPTPSRNAATAGALS